MDPHYDAQDVARCDLCEIAIVQSYCDFCHVNLCKPCIGEHISDDYTKHIIVPFQQRRSTPIYPKCKTHPNKTCKLQCKDCNIFLCTDCLASEQHNKEHKLSKLEEVFHQKKDQIHRNKKELKEELLPVYEEIATEITNQIANLDVDYQKFTTQMSKHREKLHREIDNVMDQREKEIDKNKLKHLSILSKHLKEIKQLQSLMQESLHTLNEMEESNEVTPTIRYSSKNQEFSKLPPKVIVSMPKFIPKEDLHSLIGKLTPLSTTLEKRFFKAKKPNTSVRELMDEPEVLNTIKIGHVLSETTSTSSLATGTNTPSTTSTTSIPSTAASAPTSKAPPNLPPGVLLGNPQYNVGQDTLPYFGLQQPLYGYEDLQLLQQRLPLPGYNYNLSGFGVLTSLGSRDKQSLGNVPYSADSCGCPVTDPNNPVL
uniref:Tripartite motif-containing protein 45-like n=1 Tax=Crassostrea virginica TaxID=6565 RepID=A0A8B8AE99_CRAVI|nr:tripartite motif-containing protein 45-like [Crassostrea virginica]